MNAVATLVCTLVLERNAYKDQKDMRGICQGFMHREDEDCRRQQVEMCRNKDTRF